jgi:hypothetical protein
MFGRGEVDGREAEAELNKHDTTTTAQRNIIHVHVLISGSCFMLCYAADFATHMHPSFLESPSRARLS